MAEIDLTEMVTIKNPSTGEEREIPRGAVPYFTSSDFVELDKAGRVKANQTTPKES